MHRIDGPAVNMGDIVEYYYLGEQIAASSQKEFELNLEIIYLKDELKDFEERLYKLESKS